MDRIQNAKKIAGLAYQFFIQGNFAEAASYYENACRLNPKSAEYLNNLAACCLKLDRFPETIHVTNAAIKLSPRQAFAYVNNADAHQQMGKFKEANAAYQKALELEPENPIVLTKVGSLAVFHDRSGAAKKYLEKALKIAPGLSAARLNLGLWNVSQHEIDLGRSQIEQALQDPGLEGGARRAASATLQILAEHKRIQPLLEKACKDSDPAVLHLPLEKTPDILLRIVNEELRSMEKLAVACSELKGDESQFKYKADTRHLEFMEAWTNCNQEEDLEAMANAFATLGDQSGATIITGNRNLNAVYRACTMRKRQPLGQSLDERSESWIRYWHAKLMDGDVANLPGQFKAIPNVISSGSPVSTVSPECICATLKTVFQEIRPRVPAGLKRALFTETALIKLHAFVDGNGRISRFIFNWEMESAGLDARLVTPLSKNCLPTSLDQAILNINVNQLYEDFCRIYDDGNLQLETFNHFMDETDVNA